MTTINQMHICEYKLVTWDIGMELLETIASVSFLLAPARFVLRNVFNWAAVVFFFMNSSVRRHCIFSVYLLLCLKDFSKTMWWTHWRDYVSRLVCVPSKSVRTSARLCFQPLPLQPQPRRARANILDRFFWNFISLFIYFFKCAGKRNTAVFLC